MAAAALRALGPLNTAEGLALLQRAMRAESTKVRLSGVAGLAADGGDAAVASLAWLAGADAQPVVNDAAIDALAEVAASARPGAEAAIDALIDLQALARRAEAASAALCHLGSSHLSAIARGLTHPQIDVRRRTVDTLARMRAVAATRLVLQALDDEAAAVRETAVRALARLGARGTVARVHALAQHDPSKAVRRAAADALGRLPRE